MFRNHLKMAWRNLLRQKGTTIINILGLSVGIASSLLIALWVQDELQMDKFHENGARIYRVMQHQFLEDGEIRTLDVAPGPLAFELREKYPEVSNAALMTWEQELLFTIGENSTKEAGRYVESSFLDIFSFPLIAGNAGTALQEPNSIVISKHLAEKFFGSNWQETAMGQTIRIDNSEDYQVTGILAELPNHSSLQFDYLLSIENFFNRRSLFRDAWEVSSLRLFVTLEEGTNAKTFEDKIAHIVSDQTGEDREAFLFPYEDYYLESEFVNGSKAGGRIAYVRIFSIVAVFLLLIACINFMNLATAQSFRRAKEVGLRKVIGARRGSLVGQFLTEAGLLAMVSLLFAIFAIKSILPAFNGFIGKNIQFAWSDPQIWLAAFAVFVITTLLAGIYPSFFLSSLKVTNTIKGTLKFKASDLLLRKGLVVFQFALSVLLIASSFVVYQQIEYIKNKDVGLEKDNVLFMTMEGDLAGNYENIKNQLLQDPAFVDVTAMDRNPLLVENWTWGVDWAGKDPNAQINFVVLGTQHDFEKTFDINLQQGRAFSKDFPADTENYVINKAAAEVMGFEDPIGKELTMWGTTGQIVGVINDFHTGSLHSAIEPTILRLDDEANILFMRIQAGKTQEAITKLEDVYQSLNTPYPLEYEFLDENFEQMYQSELMAGKLSNWFAGIAIFISCLGLIGLSLAAIKQRYKEIGVRKVLGASVQSIVFLLSKDFVRLAFIAFLVAIPFIYYFAQQWLEKFAYKIEISWLTFALAGVSIVGVALLTVGFQAFRAAVMNPVNSLRNE